MSFAIPRKVILRSFSQLLSATPLLLSTFISDFHNIMGWFSSSSSTSSSSEPTNDSAAPSRSERKACWDSRDLYFGCLDKNSIPVPGQEGDKCKKEDGEYRDKCAASWVSESIPKIFLKMMRGDREGYIPS